ncbi:hypothetical protein MRB53_022922 [Persea americana]|uniref:Uncharacterized protein n=1 Tax=Persea americana TaxID=3435 RepID=A0ACC2L826_PERAE|nr:hypothetical protein MRB53_022922 [Persea americana]
MQYVCKSWWSILKNTSSQLPLLMMLPNKEEEEEEEDKDARNFFSLSKKKIHTVHLPEIRGKRCCGSFKNGWLMIIDEKLDIFLFHPWFKRRIDLPHQSTFTDQNYVGSTGEEIRDLEIHKTALSDDGNMVVIAYGLGYLAFCRIGDDAYTHVEDLVFIADVIYHKGKFYALSRAAAVYLLHVDEGSHPYVEELTENLINVIPYQIFGYLVPDILTDSMLVVIRDVQHIQEGFDINEEDLPHKTMGADIFMVNLEEGEHYKTLKKYTQVESLGDRVLFLGYNSPMVVMASQFPGLKGNHIYFADNMIESYVFSPYGCSDIGILSLADGTFEQLFADRFHPILSPPLWIAATPYSS